ncbi:DUF3617 family protein [Mitsuaria sp. TWR114]|uniref:DUF3617 domain-containing protein n=1 Tax=Mitsuaria sp. TWR114 TaxID=2601731 RepID=UPI0011BF6E06|nr:DUF3617 family protein [Mitsuaria sp. TWR114]TXD70502.1 DUF3617 family protein [Mitsuaria sp. TWR114]TXD83596.1 DUF3617 family protein [Mitsuaria sp. TWR114]TXD91398.1 DUF3617 family protein [Mitsuaria sp. TWR114]
MRASRFRLSSAAASALALSLGLLTLSAPAQAQSISVKPGLWASASVNTLNGRKMPTIFEINGALTPQQKSSLAAAMAKVGLPTGASPHLDCQQSPEFALPKPQSVDDCTTQVKPGDATSGTFTMSCKSATASGMGNGSYQVTDKSSATVKVTFKGTTAQGMPITYESTSVHKWIGSDCSAPPPGIDPSVAELLQ